MGQMHKSNHAFQHKCRLSRERGEKEKREMSQTDFQVEITVPSKFIDCASLKPLSGLRSTSPPCDTR
ncbi:hypothetical protein N7516_010562 [Penicillium verrucosum]|uniref:uncharacterized protein n=1 Tax=Penicillium verrucosum TaxID=60171 RepID=UPI00254536DC|nr:uncharacterized protein N7516_010562 [Penicillium verrucosum]KAJ5922859.1 hypothetical protein N7516_010562 [Penicillium verrucosum]